MLDATFHAVNRLTPNRVIWISLVSIGGLHLHVFSAWNLQKKSWQLISSFGALFPSLSAADYGSVQHFCYCCNWVQKKRRSSLAATMWLTLSMDTRPLYGAQLLELRARKSRGLRTGRQFFYFIQLEVLVLPDVFIRWSDKKVSVRRYALWLDLSLHLPPSNSKSCIN